MYHILFLYNYFRRAPAKLATTYILLQMSIFTLWQLIEVLYCGIVCNDKSSISGKVRCSVQVYILGIGHCNWDWEEYKKHYILCYGCVSNEQFTDGGCGEV